MSRNVKILTRYRFNSKGEVVPERRRLTATFDTNSYKSGDRIFAPGRCSPARYRFRSKGKDE